MKPKETLDALTLYHELAQVAVTDGLKHYLVCASELLRLQRHWSSGKRKRRILRVAEDIRGLAEDTERVLEFINSGLISDIQNGEN